VIEIEVGKRNDSTHPTPVSTGHAFFWPWQSSEANSVPVRGSLFPRGSGGAKEKARGAAAEGAPEEGAPIDAKPTTDRCCCFHQGFSCCCSWSLSEKKLLERPIPCLTVNIGNSKRRNEGREANESWEGRKRTAARLRVRGSSRVQRAAKLFSLTRTHRRAPRASFLSSSRVLSRSGAGPHPRASNFQMGASASSPARDGRALVVAAAAGDVATIDEVRSSSFACCFDGDDDDDSHDVPSLLPFPSCSPLSLSLSLSLSLPASEPRPPAPRWPAPSLDSSAQSLKCTRKTTKLSKTNSSSPATPTSSSSRPRAATAAGATPRSWPRPRAAPPSGLPRSATFSTPR